jgi:hypothetical protein
LRFENVEQIEGVIALGQTSSDLRGNQGGEEFVVVGKSVSSVKVGEARGCGCGKGECCAG